MTKYQGFALHQIGPYVGRLTPGVARTLLTSYSNPGDWIWDPFCGSGTIPLECRLLARNTIAGDVNPYACALTRAKLHAPFSWEGINNRLANLYNVINSSASIDLSSSPSWVRSFFHPRTFRHTLALMREFRKKGEYFLSGCLLGILHHQRPGFLSYPASNLVPYLRDKSYPRTTYPDAYKFRDPVCRLAAKVERVLRFPPPTTPFRFRVFQKSALDRYLPRHSIDAVITSPPYMNTLDYARDNRLRLWFLGIEDYRIIQKEEIRSIDYFREELGRAMANICEVLKPGSPCILIIGNAKRNARRFDMPAQIVEIVQNTCLPLELMERFNQEYLLKNYQKRREPLHKTETILVYKLASKGGTSA